MLSVKLYGDLKARFGGPFSFDAHSPKEALHALMTQIPAIRQYFRENATKLFKVQSKLGQHGEDDLDYPCSSGVIKVVPIIEGYGAVGRVLAGAALMAASFLVPGSGVILGMAFNATMMGIGASLVLGGLAEMLAPRPAAATSMEKPENDPSLAFGGVVNTMGPGVVPLRYGRMRVGSKVISVGFSTSNELNI